MGGGDWQCLDSLQASRGVAATYLEAVETNPNILEIVECEEKDKPVDVLDDFMDEILRGNNIL